MLRILTSRIMFLYIYMYSFVYLWTGGGGAYKVAQDCFSGTKND